MLKCPKKEAKHNENTQIIKTNRIRSLQKHSKKRHNKIEIISLVI